MHVRRLSMLITGVWLGLTLAMLFVATENFRAVDRLLAAPAPEAAKALEKLGPEVPRQVLRHFSSELNRYYFDWYGIAQIVLAAVLLLNLLFATNGNKWMLGLSVAVLVIAIVERSVLFPEITYLGRLMDFAAPDAEMAVRARFWNYHKYFSALEVLKLVLLLIVCGKLLARGETRRRGQRQPSEALDSRQ